MAWRLRLLFWTLAVAALAALVVFGLASDRSSSVGRLAPALPSERLAGPPVTLAGVLSRAGGRPTIITFWASWCEPCAREAPALERFSRTALGRGHLIAVDWSDSLSGARAFIRRYSWTFSNVRDSEGTVGNDYRLTGLPTSFILDASGHIRAELRGPQDQASLTRALTGVSNS